MSIGISTAASFIPLRFSQGRSPRQSLRPLPTRSCDRQLHSSSQPNGAEMRVELDTTAHLCPYRDWTSAGTSAGESNSLEMVATPSAAAAMRTSQISGTAQASEVLEQIIPQDSFHSHL